MAVGSDSFEIGKWEGERQGLPMAISNFQRMFLSNHDAPSTLLPDFGEDSARCCFLEFATGHIGQSTLDLNG
jgi:hypothetical protein